jgi:hypothetical protein
VDVPRLPHPNLVTPEGLAAIEREINRCSWGGGRGRSLVLSPLLPQHQTFGATDLDSGCASFRCRRMAQLRTGGEADNTRLNAAVRANNLVIWTDPEAMR